MWTSYCPCACVCGFNTYNCKNILINVVYFFNDQFIASQVHNITREYALTKRLEVEILILKWLNLEIKKLNNIIIIINIEIYIFIN